MSVSALIEDRRGSDTGAVRPVLHGAFGVLAALRQLGSARGSDLQRGSGLTVRRLLIQLEDVGAVEPTTGRWRLGRRVLELGAGVPAWRHLRAIARRPLMDLATATGELLVIEVLPGTRPLAFEPEPGMALEDPTLVPARAYHQTDRIASQLPHLTRRSAHVQSNPTPNHHAALDNARSVTHDQAGRNHGR